MKKLLVVLMVIAALMGLMVVPVFAADKLVVMDAGGTNAVFVVQDTGNTGVGTASPTVMLHVADNAGTGPTSPTRGLMSAEHNNGPQAAYALFRKSRGTESSPTVVSIDDFTGAFENQGYDGSAYQNTAFLGFRVDGAVTAGSVPTALVAYTGSSIGVGRAERLRITSAGNLGIGTSTPIYPLQFGAQANGAYLSAGGVWTNGSSREYKDNIELLSAERAFDTIKNLNPVTYAYKADPTEKHVGFIAEDVPDLVATNDRQHLSPMDIVAVLTKVVQEQNKMIEALSAKIDMLEKGTAE